MPPRCTLCRHPSRVELEGKLIRQEITQAEVGRLIGVNQTSVRAHMQHHVPEAVAMALSPSRKAGLNVVKQLLSINQTCQEILEKARADGDDRLALQAIDRIGDQITLQAKLLGSINDGPTINVVQSPQYIELRAVILNVLQAFPEARAALVEQLKVKGLLESDTTTRV